MFTFSPRALLKVAVLAGLMGSVSVVAIPLPARAQQSLPEPYVSRALDAVLIPVNNSVASAFGLPGAGGLLVLATQPNGLADSVGILPGDVIDAVDGRQFAQPIDLDKWILFSLQNGISDFQFQGISDGAAVAALIAITLEAWEEVIDIASVVTWASYSTESFSYTEYYEEYSEELFVSYEESITVIEETITSEEYSEEMESFESSEEYEETVEEDLSEDSVDVDVQEEDFSEEDASEEEFAEDEGVEEDICASDPDDPACTGDEGDEAFEDEAVEDEPVEEDYSDEGGDDGGGDEEILEE